MKVRKYKKIPICSEHSDEANKYYTYFLPYGSKFDDYYQYHSPDSIVKIIYRI